MPFLYGLIAAGGALLTSAALMPFFSSPETLYVIIVGALIEECWKAWAVMSSARAMTVSAARVSAIVITTIAVGGSFVFLEALLLKASDRLILTPFFSIALLHCATAVILSLATIFSSRRTRAIAIGFFLCAAIVIHAFFNLAKFDNLKNAEFIARFYVSL